MEKVKRIVPVIWCGSLMVWAGLATVVRAIAAEPLTVAAPVAEVGAIAQAPNDPSGYTVLHVNAASGHDTEGIGTQLRPYQTITHALSLAEANTLILLARGTYSSESGEVFPLRLKSGVTIQGMAGPNAADVVIQGGGSYSSPAHGIQNVTILGADNAGLANVTVSNAHPEGTGLWVEAGSPIVLDNAFFRNGTTGIYLAGSGTPVVRGNYFTENGRAGLAIAGPSTAHIEANVFENTGVGITVAPDSSPEIVNNRITGNLDGLILHAEARPTLQGNQIARNRRNSVVDYAAWTSMPAMESSGTTQPPPPTVTTAAPSAPPAATAMPEREPAVPAAIAEADTANDSGAPAIAPPPPAVETTPPVADAIAATPPPTATTPTALPEAPVASPEVPVVEPEPEAIPVLPAATTAPPPAIPADNSAATVEAAEIRPPTVPEIDDGPSQLAASEPPEERFAALTGVALGDRLTTEMDETTLALHTLNVNLPPSVTSQAALETLDLAPVVEATEALAIAVADESFRDRDIDSIDSDVPPLAEPDSSAPVPADSEAESPAALPSPEPAASLDSPEVIEIPVIPPPDEGPAKPAEPRQSRETLARDLAHALETGEHLPALPTGVSTATSPSPDSERLAVPNRDIPLGSGGSLPEVFTGGAAGNLPSDGPPPPPTLANSLGLNYKVLVVAPDDATQAEVRSQVPDAFRARLNGQLFMQAGAFPTLEEAQARLNQLRQAGLQGQIQEVQ